MLADNKIFGLGVDDLETFDAFLVDLKDDLDIPGFDEELLKSMVAQAGEVTERLQEYGTLDEDEIEEIKSLESENGKIIAAFVQDPNYKRILELRYLSYKRWEEIAVSMGYTFRWTQMLHARALQQLKDNAAKNSAA